MTERLYRVAMIAVGCAVFYVLLDIRNHMPPTHADFKKDMKPAEREALQKRKPMIEAEVTIPDGVSVNFPEEFQVKVMNDITEPLPVEIQRDR